MAKQVKSTGVTLLICLLVLIETAFASQKCRTGCQGRTSPFQVNYVTGSTYVYNFEGHTIATLPGQQGDGTKLQLKATAEVSILDKCQGVLKLKDVQVTGPDSQKYSHLSDLEAHPVTFGYEKGIVDRELCTEEKDSEASVNIKRAVLSLLQVTPTEILRPGRSNVLDVFGLCPTDFSYSERGETTTITKTRNLNKCQLREHLRQDFAAVTYHTDSDLQTTPLLESTQEQRQQLKNGILNSAESHEKYLYRPFSNQEVGAKTTVDSKLVFVSQSKQNAPKTSGSNPRSLVFEPPHVGNTASSNVAAIIEALHKAHESMPDHVDATAAREFANVVTVLRQSNKDDLLSVYGQVKAGAGFKEGTKVFLDALFRAGTGDSVEVAVELLKSKKISGPYADLYYIQLAYTKHVTLPALTAAVSLLDEPEFSKLAYLGVGALGGRYCAQHRCEEVPEFDDFLDKLSKPLGNDCKTSSWDDELKVVASLKALHNVHHLNDATAKKLTACALDESLPTRVRVAALDVFQSDACRLKDTSLEILKNQQLDSELRIKAFLALVECPCHKSANALKEVLESEPTYQVGSFIVSYLRNLRASTNPSKEKIKAVFGEVRTTKRFPLDFRKFSNNFEFSYLLGGLNLGSTVESNVIYSQRSFLPRASTVNLTTELFGHSINFLELEFRQENLDLIAERLFGPKGYFNTHDLREVIKHGKEKWTDLENNVKQRLNQAVRGKRSVTKEALEEVRQKSVSPFHAEPDRELLLELSTRLFGAEVGWFTLHHNANDLGKELFDNTFDIVDKVVKKAKNFDYKLKQHNTFLDTELVYPTSLGFPLKLVASGSSAIHVDLEGKLDANELINDLKNSHIHLKFVPSAAVELVSEFVVDAYAVESGLKVATTLHTATGADINVKATSGLGVDVTFGLPIKKQDVITLKSEVLTTVHERGKPEVNTAVTFTDIKRRDYHGCFDQLSPLTGLTFCGTVSFPWDPAVTKSAFYPLNGPSNFSLTIETEDVTSYHFHASYNNKDPNKKSLQLLLETPNSKTDRKLGIILEQTLQPFQGIKAEINSPWKHLTGELAFTDSDKEISLLAKLLNDAEEYSIKLGASVTGDSSHATYKPLLEYKIPQQKGSLVAQKGVKGKPEKLSQDYGVEGSVTVDKSSNSRKFTFDNVILKTPSAQFKVDGSVTAETVQAFSTDLKVTYGEEHVILKSDFKSPAPSDIHASILLYPSQYPDFGVNFIWDYKRDKNNLVNSLVVVHGKDTDSKDSRVTLHQQAHYRYDNIHNFEFSTKNAVSYPLLGIIGKLDGKLTHNSLDIDIEASYEKHKFESELSAKTGVKNAGDYEVEFEAKVQDNSIEFETKRQIISADQSKFITKLVVKPGGTYELVADVTHHLQRDDVNFQVVAVAKVHGQPNEYKLDSGLVLNQQLFDTHYKASVGNTDYFEISAKYNRASGSPSGNAKVFLKDYLSGGGQFKYSGGKGSATFNVDIPKIDRKVKGTGDIQITGSQNVVTVDIFYNAEKDLNQKIHFHTDTDLKKDAVNSKNKFVVLDYKTEFNVKGQLIDKLYDGQLKGEFDLTLPTGSHFTGKVDRTLHLRPANSEGDIKLELTAQTSASSEPAKVTFEFAAKNVDTKQYSFDGQSKLAYYSPTGKDVAIVVAATNIPQREQRVIKAQAALQGSLIGEPVRLEFNSDIHESYIAYKGHGSYGTTTTVDTSGKVSKTLQRHKNFYIGPFSFESDIELKLPFENFKHLKETVTINGKIEENKIQVSYNEELIKDDEVYKLSFELDNEIEKGSNKLTVTSPNHEPQTYTSNWYFNYNDFKTKDLLKGGFSYNGNLITKLSVDVDGKKDLTDLNIHATLQTQHEALKNAELSLKNKYVPSPKFEAETDISLIVDDKKVTIDSKLTPGIIPGFPNIDFTATHPQGKSRVFILLQQSKGKNDVSGKAELEWTTNGGGKLTASGKANYESAQNFKIEVDVDSPALKLNKWHILLANKPAKSSKTLQITVTEAEESIINGRLEYRVEDKENSYKAGVNGNVKVRDTTKLLKAEVSFKKFTPAENGELGTEESLTFHLGELSYEVLSKFTNKETRFSSVFCSSKETCSVTEAHSVVKVIDFTHIEHEFGAKVDLKAHGYPEGFVLEGRTVRLPLSFEHKSELKLLNEKHTTYKLHSYLNEKTVGTVITLPQRVIAAEGKLGYVKEKGEHKLDLSFWLDKEKQPTNKAGVYLLVAFNPTKDGTTLQGEVKLSHPDLQKDFSIISKATVLNHDTLLDATVDFDVFDKKNQKLTLTTKLVRNEVPAGFNITGFISVKGKIADISLEGGAEVSTNGIGYNSILTYKNAKKETRQAQVLLHLTLTETLLYVKSPTADILKLERTITSLPDGKTSIEGETSVLGLQPINLEVLLNIPVSNKHTLYRKNTPNRKLVVDVLHDILTGFSFHVTLIDGDDTKDILNVGVDLTDNNFLKTHFTWSASEIKSIVERAKKDAETFLKQLKVVLQDAGEEVTSEIQDILEASKQAQPDVKAVISSYKNQLKILKEELENDEGFTGASENVKKLIKAFTTVVERFAKAVAVLADGVLTDLVKIRNGIQELLNKLLPKLKELYGKVLNLLSAVSNAALATVSKIVLKLVDGIKEHEGEIKKIAQLIQEFVEDIGKTVGTTLVQIRNEVSGFVRIVLDQVKSIPIVSNFKEQYKHFVSQLSQYLLPEQAWPVIKDVLGGVKESLPTEELKELINAVQEYVDKNVAKQSVNDVEELQLILSKAIKALKSLLTLVQKQLPASTTEGTRFLGFRLPFVLSTAFGFPKLVDFKFSPLLFLTSGGLTDLPTLKEIVHTYRPTLNPLEWLPPYRAQGVLIDLEHFITLDGRHFTFKGTCAYVLLQDVVDGNFSVAIDYASKSIVVSDQHDSVEFFYDSKFKANGQPAEYPFSSGDIIAWKSFESVNVRHKAGLFVSCKTEHSFCLIYVSGFYFGKTRGLLGTLDNEPWDDFKEPNGEVVSNVNDFGNSWKVNPSCADVSGVTHHDHNIPEPPECTHIFGGATPLRLGYFFVPSTPFREACSHIVADAATPEAKKEAACTTAAAYVALLHNRYIIVSLPSDCVHCSALSGPSVEAGDSVSVKVPQKSADVVIVIEQDLNNSEIFKDLITPLVTTLTTDLKTKGITDVHFTLIGFGDATFSYPAVYTTNGKTAFEGKTKNIKFTDHVDPFSLKLDTCENKFKYLKAFVEAELGLAAPTRAFNFAARYPFKIGTSKVLVGVVSTTRTSAFSVSLQQLAALYSVKVLRERGVAFHVVVPVDDLGLTSKDATAVKKIVGFDSDHVYSVTDAKKKVLEGSTELHQALTYTNNIWIPIALDSYGATYIAQNFIDAKPSVRKQFLQVFSRRIAESLETELHEDCTCNVLSGIYPFSDCKVTSRKEREPLAQIKASKGGVKG